MKRQDVVRIVFAVFYLFTGFINLNFALKDVEWVRGLSGTVLLPYLGDLISAVPAAYIRFTLFAFMAYQWTLFLLLLSKRVFVQLGMLGGVAFHLSIIPFGLFNLINLVFVLPLLLLIDKDYDESVPEMIFTKHKR